MSTHLQWSIEVNGRCPTCRKVPALVVAFGEMKVDSESPGYKEHGDTVTIDDEISGHYYFTCERLVSLALNTTAQQPGGREG